MLHPVFEKVDKSCIGIFYKTCIFNAHVYFSAEGGSSSLSEKDIQGCTVEKLRTMLKERNLPRTGKKVLNTFNCVQGIIKCSL